MKSLRHVVAATVNLLIIAALIVGAPILLVRHSTGLSAIWQIRNVSDQPMTSRQLTALLVALLWVVWLALVGSLVIEVVARARGVRVPRVGGLRLFQGVTAALVAGQAVTLLSPTSALAAPVADAADQHPGVTATISASPHPATPDAGPGLPPAAHSTNGATTTGAITTATMPAGDRHTVVKGDSLWRIAERHLDQPARWPEVWQLNQGKAWPGISGRTTFDNPDLILPGWVLTLPTPSDPAVPGQPAPRTPPQHADPTPPVTPGAAVPAATPTAGQVSPSPSAASPPATPGTSPAPSTMPTGDEPIGSPDPASTSGQDGVLLPGGWVTWTLAAAISTAAALVWLQRRRRYTTDTEPAPLTDLPASVAQIHRAVTCHSAVKPAVPASGAALSPPGLPRGGAGLCGPGATGAARAALVEVLASGGPGQPQACGEVVIDTATLATLIGSHSTVLLDWTRLHVADDIDHALTLVEHQLLHRTRLLDHDRLTDLDTLLEQAPDEEALPPLLLITASPPPHALMRAITALNAGAGLGLSAILLGAWEHGSTIDVTADGHTHLITGQPASEVPARLPVLDGDTAAQILGTLREAHTGQPPPDSQATQPLPLVTDRAARQPAEAAEAVSPPAPPPSSPGHGKAVLHVLGRPRIDTHTTPARKLRAKALELAVFLACHPDGATTRAIGEHLEPDARLSQSDQRVHTNASNLRHNLTHAGHADTTDTSHAYLIKTGGRYRLDPATVEVDLWRMRDLLRTAELATGPHRRALLTQACDLYGGPLADGHDYEWITPHREAARRWATQAHLLLADELLPDQPQAASDLLDKAIRLDHYNEALYRKAMHARHHLGDTDGIRALLRALTKALADLDAQPDQQTLTLAATLRHHTASPATNADSAQHGHTVPPSPATGPQGARR